MQDAPTVIPAATGGFMLCILTCFSTRSARLMQIVFINGNFRKKYLNSDIQVNSTLSRLYNPSYEGNSSSQQPGIFASLRVTATSGRHCLSLP